MTLRLCLCLLPLLLMTSQVAAVETACEGAFAIDSSEARLIEIYGADNVRTGIVPGPEGTEMLATEVYPDSAKRRLQFVWWNEEARTDLSYVELPPKMTGPGGVRYGMSVAQVEALNGAPFTLSGFGWDYGGHAGFEAGALSNLPGGCAVGVTFSPENYPEGLEVDEIIGDRPVQSTNPLLRQVNARVDLVFVSYPHPDYRE
jgi:hypothetical protein